MEKRYLGDSVYVETGMFGDLVLTTENGLPNDPSNRIVLEPEVALALARYMQDLANYLERLHREADAACGIHDKEEG